VNTAEQGGIINRITVLFLIHKPNQKKQPVEHIQV